MTKKIFIHSKEEIFSVRDLSELLYNIDNIYKILIFEKEEKKKLFYYKVKLPLKDALLINRISKESPFGIEISPSITYGDILQTLVSIISIAAAIRLNNQNQTKDKKDKENLRNFIRRELERKRIKISEELVSEIAKLSKRRIKIEIVREEEN